ncbi:family 20 glycosylhydrolase [Kitasatospora sp. NPDC001574]
MPPRSSRAVRHRGPRLVLAAALAALVGAAGMPTVTAAAAPAADPAAAPATALIPQPVVIGQNAGAAPFVLRDSLVVVAAGEAAPIGAQLAEQLRAATGFQVPVRQDGGDNAIRITVDPAAKYTVGGAAPTDESYVLDVDQGGVSILARTGHGAFNGVQSLRQLLPAWASSVTPVVADWQVPATHIEDAPRFSYRGVMLDVARSFKEVDEVKRTIDTLSRLKMSVLQLHLSDDQGWRIEITNEGKAAGDPIDYTALTRVSGTTAMNEWGYRNELGRTGYYTQAQYRDIVAYAKARFVTVVPEVDVPGHSNAALHAIPQLNTQRSLPAPQPGKGSADWNGTHKVGYSALDERNELSYTFIDHVFRQLAGMTGGPYVHIGGDEAKAMGTSRYVDFVKRAVPRVQKATGVGTIGWSEYAQAGLSQGPGYWNGSVVQYWEGDTNRVRDFVSKGGKAVVSDATGAYLDQKYTADTPIGLSWACKTDIEPCDFQRYYDWDPTTKLGLPEAGVLGVSAPLWSETVRGREQAEFLTMPRAAAVLEIGWTPAARKNTADFGTRLARFGPYLTVAGTNFYESPGAKWSATVAGTHAVAPNAVTARHRLGLVAAPGTKLSANGTAIVPDTVATDGDPASSTTLAKPLTATATCADTTLPVTFTQSRPRDNLHGAGLYTASVEAKFTQNTTCVLTPTEGKPVTVQVTMSSTPADGGAQSTPGAPAISAPQDVTAGTWVPLELTGFAPGYVDIRIDDKTVYTVRAGEDGRFTRHGVIPAATQTGPHTISAVQGNRSARTTATVNRGAPLIGIGAKCADVTKANTADSTPLQLYSCNGTMAQNWTLSTEDSSVRAFGKCMDVRNGATANGSVVQLYTCNATPAQQWTHQPDNTLKNVKSGRCLSAENSSTTNGARLLISDCNGSSNQRWTRGV